MPFFFEFTFSLACGRSGFPQLCPFVAHGRLAAAIAPQLQSRSLSFLSSRRLLRLRVIFRIQNRDCRDSLCRPRPVKWSVVKTAASLFSSYTTRASCCPLTLQTRSSTLFPMDPSRELGRTLLVVGGVVLAAGAFLYFSGKLPFRLGRLPGDIVHKSGDTTFYFPIVTCVVISAVLSLVFWLISHLRR